MMKDDYERGDYERGLPADKQTFVILESLLQPKTNNYRDCRRVARFAVGQNIFRARDNRVEVPEWRHVIRSFFSEISLFPGSGSIARFKYTPGNGKLIGLVSCNTCWL